MTFEEAVREMIKKYFAGLSPDELKTASGKKNKYNKKFFDKVAKEHNIDQSDLDQFSEDM